eukprot:COSAG03_NODE_5036_length_1358_cov_20.243050_2_plen_138_part_01
MRSTEHPEKPVQFSSDDKVNNPTGQKRTFIRAYQCVYLRTYSGQYMTLLPHNLSLSLYIYIYLSHSLCVCVSVSFPRCVCVSVSFSRCVCVLLCCIYFAWQVWSRRTEAGRPVWLGQGVWLLLAVGQGPRAEETPGTQ